MIWIDILNARVFYSRAFYKPKRFGLCINIVKVVYNMANGIFYSFSFPSLPTLDIMTDEQFNKMLSKGLEQAKAGQGFDIEDAFVEINESI